MSARIRALRTARCVNGPGAETVAYSTQSGFAVGTDRRNAACTTREYITW